MNKEPEQLIDKFISGKSLTTEEFILLDNVFNNLDYLGELSNWLKDRWQNSKEEVVRLKFANIREKIKKSRRKLLIERLFIGFSKVAAILFIPLMVAALYFYFHHVDSFQWLSFSTQKGEQTSITLPDGTEVWLNVDTKLSYPMDFGVNNRKLKLTGEAYFHVKRNENLPFEVSSGSLTTRALGTEFVVSAYPGDNQIKSSLVNGSVDVIYKNKHQILKQGEQLLYNDGEVSIKNFDKNIELAWKDAQLVFRLTPFDKVIEELEKWYDINIIYDKYLFKNETLTVRFEQEETLEHVLQVMAKANGFYYKTNGKNVYIYKYEK